MTDKQWLDKVAHAARVYNETQQGTVTDFVEWLYKQYGIEYFSDTSANHSKND